MKRKITAFLILTCLSITAYASVVYYGPGRAVFLENIIQFANFLELEAISTKKLRVGGEVIAHNFQGANIRKNYIPIGAFELTGENFTSYVDAAGIVPVDGTGGTSTFLTCDRSAVTPLEGNGSLLISKFNSALGGQGHGCSYTFTLDSASLNQNLVISFDYLWADADSSNGDFAVFLYDVDNATLVTPSTTALSESSTVINYSSSFAVTTGVNYRFIIHQTLSRAGIFDLKIDNLFIGKQSKLEGVNVSSSGIPSNYVLSSNGAGAATWSVPPLVYSTTDEYFGVSTAAQTVIDLGYDVSMSNKANFQLFIDGVLFNEGATYDYEFTSISGGLSSEVTLNSSIPAALTIRGLYHGAYGTSLSNPMTAEGDMIYGIPTGVPARLPIGTEGHVLTVSGGVPAWTASGAGLFNPMTTAEDIIKGGVAGVPNRLAVGSNGQVLTVNGSGAVVWADPAASFTNPMTTAEDMIVGGVGGLATRLAKGTDGKVLQMAAGAVSWQTPAADVGFTNPLTTAGDLFVGGVAGAPDRLGIGSANSILKSDGSASSWSNAVQIDGSGLVGVGTAPVASTALSVAGAGTTVQRISSTAAAGTTELRMGEEATGDRAVHIYMKNANTGGQFQIGIIGGSSNNAQLIYSGGGALAFKTVNAAAIQFYTSNTFRGQINGSGFLGMGGTSAVYGSVIDARVNTNPAIANGAGTFAIRSWTDIAQAAGVGGAISLGGSITATALGTTSFGQISGRKENSTLSDAAGYLSFSTNATGGTMAERMRISSDGVVTIANLAGSGSRAVNADANGVLSAASDSRLKQEVPDAEIPGLAEILKIFPKAYKWLSDIDRRGENAAVEIGFFADQVAPIIPSAAPMGNDGYYGLYDRSITAALVKAVQELSAKNSALEARILTLENKGGVP